MTDNNHLDIGQIQEENEYWFEDIDLSCPYCSNGTPEKECEKCDGDGEYPCPNHEGNWAETHPCEDPDCENGVIGCEECKGLGTIESDGGSCEACNGNGDFEILWNTAFRIPYLKDGLAFNEARELAWQRGWLLFEYEDEKWIASGSCGYDFTWVKAACALEICGNLPEYYADQLQGGGDVFLHDPAEKKGLIEAAIEANGYRVQRIQRDIKDLENKLTKLEFEAKIKLEQSHATLVKKES